MPDPFAQRAETLHRTLLDMERDAAEEDLFAIGYMIPQIGLVLEMAEYDPSEVEAEDFDATYWQWLESTFAEDGMSDEDRSRIEQLWEGARDHSAA
ncbi:YfcL protein [Modicisalibacter ilicicola DSM 19980]|uniref:YfcL protein n=1 Tax=Modicisalibacter ilicicola DSM 19980 TaxID=1121942 RepID=A0A1M4X926_9GAMM|nr:YfcL family protein [Halomonas ilicicola]SHE90019.1 YfcL protein [Halomonas ilicicola DSM 19980]